MSKPSKKRRKSPGKPREDVSTAPTKRPTQARSTASLRARFALAAPIGVLVLVTLFAFGNSLHPSFVWDDEGFLPIPRAPGESFSTTFGRLFREDVWASRRMDNTAWRPLSMTTILLDELFWGKDLQGFHITNVALHVAVSVGLFLLIQALLARFGAPTPDRKHDDAWLPALVATAVFAVHPIHTDAVDSVFNRSEILATLLSLAALGIFWRWEPRRPVFAWAAALLGYVTALLCKESAAPLPVSAALLVFLRADGALRDKLRRTAPAAALLVGLVAYGALRQAVFVRHTGPVEPVGTVSEGLAMSLTGFRDGLALMLWPHPLRVARTDYSADLVVVAAIVVVAFVAALVVSYRRGIYGVTWGLAFYALGSLPTLRFVTRLAQAQPFAERYLYLPSMGLAVALAFGVRALVRRASPTTVGACGLAATLVLTLATRARNAEWSDSITLLRAELRAKPQNGDVLMYLGNRLRGTKRWDEMLELCRAHLRDPVADNPHFHLECGMTLSDRGALDEAEASHKRAIDVGATPAAHYTYGRLLVRLGRNDEAEREYAIAVDTLNDPVRKHTIRAEWLLKLHPERLQEALTEIDAALAADPGYAIARGIKERIVAALRKANPTP
jgi:hypothetical protein